MRDDTPDRDSASSSKYLCLIGRLQEGRQEAGAGCSGRGWTWMEDSPLAAGFTAAGMHPPAVGGTLVHNFFSPRVFKYYTMIKKHDKGGLFNAIVDEAIKNVDDAIENVAIGAVDAFLSNNLDTLLDEIFERICEGEVLDDVVDDVVDEVVDEVLDRVFRKSDMDENTVSCAVLTLNIPSYDTIREKVVEQIKESPEYLARVEDIWYLFELF